MTFVTTLLFIVVYMPFARFVTGHVAFPFFGSVGWFYLVSLFVYGALYIIVWLIAAYIPNTPDLIKDCAEPGYLKLTSSAL